MTSCASAGIKAPGAGVFLLLKWSLIFYPAISILSVSYQRANITYLGHCHPSHTFMLVDVLNYALMHKEDVWATRYIWVDSHGKDEFV
ncbi:hypothetical protein FJTKL_09135 [Diaporthe vaccinii]|uniref:Uncharacterized protein n=1 Tax=Diaporthe vaccinii TaxID=105482 RepID=A0ABR4ENZ6_9PEZI